MDPAFGLHVSKSIGSLDCKGYTFYPGLIASKIINNFGGESPSFYPPRIHPEEHLRPILSFCTTSPGVNCDDGVVRVFLTAEHRFQFRVAHSGFDSFNLTANLFDSVFVILFFRHFEEQF